MKVIQNKVPILVILKVKTAQIHESTHAKKSNPDFDIIHFMGKWLVTNANYLL
jgi:hypothetical protein